MIPRTVVHQDSELFATVKNSMPGRVTVRTADGRELTDEVLYPKGNPQNPLTEDEFKAKFMDMAERVLGNEQAEELYGRARDLRDIPDVADLAPLWSAR
jgi:2-methylcitrate dehydratase PrpD